MKKLKDEYRGTTDLLMRHDYHRDTRKVFGTRLVLEQNHSPKKWSYLLSVFVAVCLAIIVKTIWL